MNKVFFVSNKLFTTHLARTEEDRLIENVLDLWEENLKIKSLIFKNNSEIRFFIKNFDCNYTIEIFKGLLVCGYIGMSISYYGYEFEIYNLKNNSFHKRSEVLFYKTKSTFDKQELEKKEKLKLGAIIKVEKDLKKIRNGK